MAIYEIKDLRNIREVPVPVMLQKPVVLTSINPDNYVPEVWLTDKTDFEQFDHAYMGFDVPDILHNLLLGGGNLYTFYGHRNAAKLVRVNQNIQLETTRSFKVLKSLLTVSAFEVLYEELSKIENIK